MPNYTIDLAIAGCCRRLSRRISSAKKLLVAAWKIFAEAATGSPWIYSTDYISTPGTSSILVAWLAYRRQAILPYTGGFLDQPLSVLARFDAIDYVYNACGILEHGDDWSKLSEEQSKFAKWITNNGT